ncbi:hypothetical protein [Micromonospora harpali]|uniref:Lipopolysaccharide export system protein LptA n=1 Tax=Micromonospora harpali TaxID=1490225 RepID=A0ABW1I0Y2_9ACTN
MYKKALPAALAAAALAALTLAPAAPAAAATGELIEVIHTYTETVKESNSSFMCPANEVMIGRAHYGDENGKTTYRCGRIYVNGEQASVELATTKTLRERDSYYAIAGDAAIIGRKHIGDENGYTTYYVGRMFWQGRTVRLATWQWDEYLIESNHSSRAGANRVMTGREHVGDENGLTRYEYSTLQLGAPSGPNR